jgi:hypothetical protein
MNMRAYPMLFVGSFSRALSTMFDMHDEIRPEKAAL